MSVIRTLTHVAFLGMACLLLGPGSAYAQVSSTSATSTESKLPAGTANVSTQGSTQDLRFAPGDVVPLTVKLTNFGSTARTDVTVYYDVKDPTGKNIFTTSETVAVETTANYVKNVPLSPTAVPGAYTVTTSVTYQGQNVPAVSSFQFTVERTYFGVYQSELVWYLIGIGLIVLVIVLLLLLLLRRARSARFEPHDYSGVAPEMRIYYELISDAIQQMRYHEGDRAIALAQSIPGLSIDPRTGRVQFLAHDPATIMATLISSYHTRFNRNVNLAFNQQSDSRAIVR